jgi:hypothetical protein
VKQEYLDHPDHLDYLDQPEYQVLPVLPVQLEKQVQLDQLVIQEKQDLRD